MQLKTIDQFWGNCVSIHQACGQDLVYALMTLYIGLTRCMCMVVGWSLVSIWRVNQGTVEEQGQLVTRKSEGEANQRIVKKRESAPGSGERPMQEENSQGEKTHQWKEACQPIGEDVKRFHHKGSHFFSSPKTFIQPFVLSPCSSLCGLISILPHTVNFQWL